MRGASAESLEVLTEALATSISEGNDASRLADDLFAVAEVLRGEPSLRRMTTDLSLPAEAKAGFVRQLLSAQLGEPALDLVALATGQRWAVTRDLADSLEQLGVIAVVRGAEKEGKADQLEDELFAFGRMVSQHPGLRDALSDPARSAKDKRALLHRLMDKKAIPATVRLAEQAVTGSHHTVALAIEDYQRVAADNRNRLVATVRVARDLTDSGRMRLEQALASQYGKPVHLNVVVDPGVVGGIRVEIGNEVIDGTLVSRLDEARRRLAG
jgi:F-type H+-transporting ATPase subunit delta